MPGRVVACGSAVRAVVAGAVGLPCRETSVGMGQPNPGWPGCWRLNWRTEASIGSLGAFRVR